MKNKLGVMQGRLVNSEKKNKIQYFPEKNWQLEFKLANLHKINTIEWTVNYQNIKKNPLYNGQLQEIKILKKKYNINIKSLTCDFFMEKPFFKKNFFNKRNLYLKILSRVIKNGKKIGIDFFILPLVDKASIQDLNEEKKLIIGLNNILKKIKGSTRLLLETDYKPSSVLGFVKKFKSFKVGINYDTGNSAALGYNFYDELTYFKFVKNIHIKDRFLNGNTTRLGTGAWNYKKFFLGLKKINYNKNLILQTARSRTGRHLEEIVYSMNFIKKFYV